MLHKQPSTFIKNAVKKQMLRPITFCKVGGVYCRFHIPGYCLEEFKPYACPSSFKVKEKEVEGCL